MFNLFKYFRHDDAGSSSQLNIADTTAIAATGCARTSKSNVCGRERLKHTAATNAC